MNYLQNPKEDFTFTKNFDLQALLFSLPQVHEPTPVPAPPPGVQPMPSDLSQSPKEPFPDELKAPNNQIWVAGHIHLQLLIKAGKIKARKKALDKYRNAETWWYCGRGEVEGWSGSIACDDPECSTGWYHWECLSDLDRYLALTFVTWLCTCCWSRRAVECLTKYPNTQHWPKNVSGLEQMPEASRNSLVTRINHHFEDLFSILADSKWDWKQHPKARNRARRDTEHLRHGLKKEDKDTIIRHIEAKEMWRYLMSLTLLGGRCICK